MDIQDFDAEEGWRMMDRKAKMGIDISELPNLRIFIQRRHFSGGWNVPSRSGDVRRKAEKENGSM